MKLSSLLPLFLATLTSASAANLVGLWEFDNPSALGKATVGTDLIIKGTAPSYSASKVDGASTTLNGVISTVVGAGNHLDISHNIGANGGGTYTNQYSFVYDVKRPDQTKWRAFFQADKDNNNDAEYFTRGGGGVANSLGLTSIGYSSTAMAAETWMRLIISADLQAGTFVTYIDGALFHTHTAPAHDGSFSLYTDRVLFFADNDGENETLDVGAIAIYDAALTAAEVAALGTVGSAIPLPGNPPVLSVQDAITSPIITKAETLFSFLATDPKNSDVQIQVDWGNGVISGWTTAAPSASAQQVSYAYPYAGDFTIRARARDASANTSEWLAIQTLTVTPTAGIPDGLAGLWEFDDPGNLGHATYGTDLTIVGGPPSYEASRADDVSSPLNGVITTLLGPTNHLLASHGIGANGHGSKTNEYTIVFDVLVPAVGAWHSLFQTNPANNDDGEYFFRNTDNALGVNSITYSTTSPPANHWIRLALSANLANAGFLRTYIDGALLHTHSQPGLDSRMALDPASLLLFGDEDGDNHPLAVGMVAMFAKALSTAEIEALGTSGSNIISNPDNHAPSLASQPAGPLTAATGVAGTYTFLPTDPDGDLVQVQVDWGDGKPSAWSPFGTVATARVLEKTWNLPGAYAIAARARDTSGAASDWVAIQSVTVTGDPVISIDFATPPYLQNMSTTTMVVMAEVSDADTPLTLEYGISADLGSSVTMESAASGGGTFYVRGILTGLQPGTTYHYRLAASGYPVTPDATFRTAPASWEDFSFSALGDTQTTNGGAWSASPWQPARTMFQDMVNRGVAFGLGLGDESDNGSNYNTTKEAHLKGWCSIVGPHVPFFHAWGNHDQVGPSNPLRLGTDMPSRWQIGDSPSSRAPGQGNYSYAYSGVFFVCLDWWQLFSDFQGASAKALDDPTNDLTNGWLDAQLSSAAARAARFKVVALHNPPFSERWRDGSEFLRTQLVPRMEQYGVDLCFSGHVHEYQRGALNGVNYVICGCGSYLDIDEPIVKDWPHMTMGGSHNVPGVYARESSPGVLGTPQPIQGGLFHGYSQITVRDRYLRLDQHGFNADGSYIGILDTLELGGSDPGPDSDGDGMRDAWENANGLRPDFPDAILDLDGDGQSNIAEMIAGTAPNDASSVLRATGVKTVAGGLDITWTSVPGKRYRFHLSADLGAWQVVMDGAQSLEVSAAAGATTTHTIPLPQPPPANSFIRVEALQW